MARKKKPEPIDILKEKVSALFRIGAGKTREAFLLLRPLSTKEQWGLDSIKEYISEDTAKKITAAVKQNKAKLKFIKKGFSFLVANKDLIPQLDSRKFKELNKRVEREYFSTSFKNFTERAWQALPQYIGPNTLGQVVIKQAICLQLFSPEPVKIQIIGGLGSEMLDCAKNLSDNLQLNLSEKKTTFDLLFLTKESKLEEFEDIAEKIILGSKAKLREADIEFLREYIKEGRKIEVEIPAHLSEKLKNFIVGLKKMEKKLEYKVTPAFISCVVNLCKASAKMELRSEVESKDLARVFEVVEKSIKG